MPSSSRDTGTIKFGGENVPETILRLVIAFFIDKTSNKKQIYIENTPNMVFIFFHAKTGSLPILQECPMCSILLDGKQGVAVEVILGRPVFSSFLTVNKKKISRMKTRYIQVTLPTCMLMFLSQMINSFTDQYVTMVVQVNLTVMLVLSTL